MAWFIVEGGGAGELWADSIVQRTGSLFCGPFAVADLGHG